MTNLSIDTVDVVIFVVAVESLGYPRISEKVKRRMFFLFWLLMLLLST